MTRRARRAPAGLLDLRIVAQGRLLAPAELSTVLGARLAARKIGRAVDLLITLLDDLEGDPDLEQEEDACAARDDDPGVDFGDGRWCPGDPEDAEEGYRLSSAI